MSSLFLDDARRAFEDGGPGRLDAYLRRLNSYTDAEHHLLDRNGTRPGHRPRSIRPARGQAIADSGASEARPRSRAWPFGTRNTPAVRIRSSDDNRYRLVTIVAPTTVLEPVGLARVFSLAAAPDRRPVLPAGRPPGLALEEHSGPSSSVSAEVTWAAGLNLTRHDEIGDLAHSFNRMAEQITTLRSAERRLLQDVSHELRSPLARLGFAVELARTSSDREAALTRIRNEADRSQSPGRRAPGAHPGRG